MISKLFTALEDKTRNEGVCGRNTAVALKVNGLGHCFEASQHPRPDAYVLLNPHFR